MSDLLKELGGDDTPKKESSIGNTLVIGGLGFIGHYVAMEIKKMQHEGKWADRITVADNRTTWNEYDKLCAYHDIDQQQLLLAGRTLRLKKIGAMIEDVDCNNYEQIGDVMRGHPETVIHLASAPNQKVVKERPWEAFENTVSGLRRTLAVCNAEHFVYVSSSMVYGNFAKPITETHPTNYVPTDTYACYKLMCEEMVKNWAAKQGSTYTIIRPCAVYGPWDTTDRVVAKFCLAGLRDNVMTVRGSTQKMPFTYVQDCARGIAQAVYKKAQGIYNISGNKAHTLLELAKGIKTITGQGDIDVEEAEEGMPQRNLLITDKAKQDFGYEPQVDLQQGVTQTLDWLKHSGLV